MASFVARGKETLLMTIEDIIVDVFDRCCCVKHGSGTVDASLKN